MSEPKKSSKFQIPQTPIDFGPETRSWNEEFESTWREIEQKVNVSGFESHRLHAY